MSNLFLHQKVIIDEDKKKVGLFLGTGSSKTRIALELAQGNILCILPKTQKQDCNWERENKKWNINKNITTISKEIFRRDYAKLPKFDTVIIDECHTVLGATPNVRWVKKNPIPKTSQLFEAVKLYLVKHNPERLYLCTATIIRNPMTVWAAAELLGYKFDFYKWRDAFYFRLPMQGRDIFQAKNDNATKERLATVVRRLGYTGQLSEYFDVPEQSYKVIKLDLTKEQRDILKKLPIEYPDPLVLLGKQHQLENGILIGNEFEKTRFFDNEKLDKILELSIEFPKMVVFCKYTAQIEEYEKRLVKEGKIVITLQGSTKDRGEVIKRANELDECIFIAQAQVSAGWELPDYPVMVFASMSYSVVDRIQGEGRILRANALKKNLYIDLITKNGIDQAVYDSIANKKDFNERIYINQKFTSK